MSNRTHRLSFAATLRRWGLAIVAIAIVGAQAYGGLHRIEHAHLAGGSAAFDTSHQDHGDAHDHAHDLEPPEGGKTGHNCAAIDALALGDGPPVTATLAAAEEPVTGVRFAAAVLPAAHARPCPFEARAPPSHTS